jgi:hypothetical protein
MENTSLNDQPEGFKLLPLQWRQLSRALRLPVTVALRHRAGHASDSATVGLGGSLPQGLRTGPGKSDSAQLCTAQPAGY